jgi:GGDEF domain-containing protein
VADDLAATVRRPVDLACGPATVGVSIGLSVFPDDGDEFRDLLHAADQRMCDRKSALHG